MKFICSILITIFLLSGCKKEEVPQLPDETLIDVLVDLHLAEASMISLSRIKKDSATQIYYDMIFEIHEVNDSIFFQDFELLRKDTKRIGEIYNKVFEKIEQLGIDKEKPKEEKKPDEEVQK